MTDPWEPLFSRRGDGLVEIGLVLATPHCNSRGLVHGGVIAALADNAMGLSYVAALSRDLADATPVSAVTVSLTLDYVAAGGLGQWLQVTPRVLKAGRTTGFVDVLVRADDVIIARASATFRANARPTE